MAYAYNNGAAFFISFSSAGGLLGIVVQLANCIYVMKLFGGDDPRNKTDKASARMLLVGSSNPTFNIEDSTNRSLSYQPTETTRSSSSANSLHSRTLAINTSELHEIEPS